MLHFLASDLLKTKNWWDMGLIHITCVILCCLPYLFRARQNKKKTKIGNLYNQVPYLTQDTILESDKNTRKHLIQESQEVSPFLAGDHKAAWHKQYTMAKTDPK